MRFGTAIPCSTIPEDRVRRMVIELELKDDVCILRNKGRFATGTDAAYLRAKTDEIKKSGRRKVLADFHEVPYIDSTGIGFVVAVYTSVTTCRVAASCW